VASDPLEAEVPARRTARRRVGPRLLSLLQLAALGVVFLIVAVRLVPAARNDVSFAAFYTAARVFVDQPANLSRIYDNDWFNDQVHQHGFPHLDDIYNVNPPTLGVALMPLAAVRPAVGRWAWPALNLVALVAGVALLLRAFEIPLRWLLPVVAIAALTEPVAQHFERNQIYLILFALVCVMVSAWVAGRRGAAGAMLGTLVGGKTACGWFALERLFCRDWRTIGAAMASAAVIVAASLAVAGTQVWTAYVVHLPYLATAPQRYVTAYQTVTSLFGHLFVFDARWNRSPIVDVPVLATALTALVVLASLGLSIRYDAPRQAGFDARALSIAMGLSLVVANAPLGEDYHYVLVLPSLFIAWWALVRRSAAAASWAWLGLATLALVAPWDYKNPALNGGAWALLAYPRVYGSYLLWAWLVVALRRLNAPETAALTGRASPDLA
jgi:hypothetical protein